MASLIRGAAHLHKNACKQNFVLCIAKHCNVSAAICCCRLVAAFRKWLDMRGGGGPPTKLPQKLPPLVDRQEVFLNRYEQHTRHCPYCSGVSILTHGGLMPCGSVHHHLVWRSTCGNLHGTLMKGLEVCFLTSSMQQPDRGPIAGRACTYAEQDCGTQNASCP